MKKVSKLVSMLVICAMLGTGIPMPAYAVQNQDEINLTVEDSDSQSSVQSENPKDETTNETADNSESGNSPKGSSDAAQESNSENADDSVKQSEANSQNDSDVSESETGNDSGEAVTNDEKNEDPEGSGSSEGTSDESQVSESDNGNIIDDQNKPGSESGDPQNSDTEESLNDDSQNDYSSENQTSDGGASDEDALNEESSNGETMNGDTSNGETTNGETSNEEATDGEDVNEATADEDALDEDIPDSEEVAAENEKDKKNAEEGESDLNKDGSFNTVDRPEEYSIRPNAKNESASTVYSMSGSVHALLIQSTMPWDTDSNVEMLDMLKTSGKIDDYYISSVADATGIDFSEFKVILFANDQSSENYIEYEAIKTALEGYVYNGGVVLFGACDSGWSNGTITTSLLNGVTKEEYFEYHNYVVDSSNPIVTGIYSEKTALTDTMLECNYCSHVTFNESTLPQGSKVILRGKNTNAPTLVEYPYGQGNVILSGLTWEYAYEYVGRYSDEFNMQYGVNSFDDYILYGLALSNIDVTKQVLNPISIDLSSKKLSISTDYESRYKITAQVINNNGDDSITDVFAKLTLPEGSGIMEGGNPQMSSIVQGGQSTTFEWEIYIDNYTYSSGGSFIYSVNAGSSKTMALSQKGIIHLNATDGQSKEFDFDRDVWEFPNFSDHTHCNIRNSVALYQGLSPSEKAEMKQVVKYYEDNGNTGGHCYGMAVSSILFKMGIENTNSLFGVDNLRSVKKSDGESLIDYYHVTQHLKVPSAAIQNYLKKSKADRVKTLDELASKVNSGGTPVLLAFYVKNWGHAVVAYACEPGEFKSNTTHRKYNRRILIYDSNSTNFWGNKCVWSDKYCLLFNEGTDEWEIPGYCTGKDGVDEATSRNSYAKLSLACADLDIIDSANRQVGAYNYSAEVRCNNATKFKIFQNGILKWLTDDVLNIDELVAYHDFTDENGGSSNLHIVLPDENATYGFETQSGQAEKVNVHLLYNNACYVLDSSQAKAASVDPKGKVELKGNESDYTIILANDNPSGNNFDTYTITGNGKGDISAEVTEEGIKITGDSLKGAKVTAQTGDQSSEITVESDNEVVLKKGNDNSIETANKVTGIKLNKKSLTIGKKGKYKLVATVTPKDAANQKIKWKSSNSKIASVSADGVVKAKKIGKCKITATTEDGGFKAVCKIKVTKTVKVTSVSLNKTSATLKKGATLKLKAKIKPKNATIKDVTWKSSNTSVAKVSKKGKVTAKKKGTCYITVKTKNGKKTAKCKITVK